jgi:hypothetical protein
MCGNRAVVLRARRAQKPHELAPVPAVVVFVAPTMLMVRGAARALVIKT